MIKNLFGKIAELILTEGIKEVRKRVSQEKKKSEKKPLTKPKLTPSNQPEEKIHPWRTCPIGQHWRRTHSMQVPISEKNPSGITIRHVGCCNNPKRKNKKTFKDILHPEEIHQIAENYFKNLTGLPVAGKLKEFENADNYDEFIRGWTKYWNEVFKPEDLLDPDLVKALIASESGFNLKPKEPNAGAAGKARGLIQLTDQAVEALANPKGELVDHLVLISQAEITDPNVVICAGIRWLFQKRKLASNKLKRQATWEETVAEYKNYLKGIISERDKDPKGMHPFKKLLRELKK
jgi:hypothetical protein